MRLHRSVLQRGADDGGGNLADRNATQEDGREPRESDAGTLGIAASRAYGLSLPDDLAFPPTS